MRHHTFWPSCLVLLLVLAGGMGVSHAQGVISGPPQTGGGGGGGGGGGVAPPSTNPGWIAVAGGFGGNGRFVDTGFSGLKNSRGEAEQAALSACRRGKRATCRNPFAVSSGCLYIVPGTRSGGVTWGRGGTIDAALNECRRGGYSCDRSRVIGGCVN